MCYPCPRTGVPYVPGPNKQGVGRTVRHPLQKWNEQTMKLAYSSNAYMRYDMGHAIDSIASLGFRGIELMADRPHAWPAETTDRQIDAIRRHLDHRGLTISNVNAFMMNAVGDFWHPSWIEHEKALRQERLQHTIRALSMAAKLGALSITTEPGGPLSDSMSREHALDLFCEGLTQALRHAEDEGVRLLVEPEPDLLIENADQCLELTQRVNSPMLGLNFDVGHFYCVSDPLPETIARLAPFTQHYHLEDIAASRVHEHLIPGRGSVDFEEVISAIKNTGYDDWLTIELYPYLDDPDGAGREAAQYLSRWVPS